MALVEKQIVFKRKAENGDTEMHFPVTRAEYVEGAVLTVNGESPDSTGNVKIDVVASASLVNNSLRFTKTDGESFQIALDASFLSKDGGNIAGDLTVGYMPVVLSVNGTPADEDGNVALDLSNYLPLDGGTMTDTIKTTATQALTKTTTSGGLGVYGGTSPLDGAHLVVYGKDSTEAGKFALAANNGTDKVYLYGYADGSLTWNGKNVTVEGDCLPFSGGAMTAAVAMTRNVDSDALQLHGGTSSANGAGLWLYGKDKANLQGTFRLRATASGENIDLIGHKNGTLTWGGKNVLRSTSGTTDLTAGTSALETGTVYLMYE